MRVEAHEIGGRGTRARGREKRRAAEREDLLIGEDALLLEIDPERGLRGPDHRRKDRFFDGREIFDERTSLLEFFECAQKDLNDLQKGVAVQRVDRQKPLEVMRSISMSEENQEKRQSQERLEKFIVVNQFPGNERSIEREEDGE